MLDYIEIGPAPCDEKCEQANISGTIMRDETREPHQTHPQGIG
jgi:hypothetical protein